MSGTPLTVAVIGLGSRGLSVLERLVTLAGRTDRLALELIDPRADGAGVHARDQPDYLLLNTIASQVSMFPDRHTVGATARPGPHLHQWVTERGLRLAEDGYTAGAAGRPIGPADFLPRRLLGEYLGWFLDTVRRAAPPRVRIRVHRAEAVDLAEGPGGGLTVVLAGGATLPVDHAFLTTGYTANQAAVRPGAVGAPYPLPAAVSAIRPGETVAVGGFGLTAMDLMSALTVGRGGRFLRTGAGVRYRPSGREPRLVFYSRSGLPCRARPRVMEIRPYRPVVLTPEAVDAARAARGRLDLDRDLLPLVHAELRLAYRASQLGVDVPPDPVARDALLDRLDREHGRFDPEAVFLGTGGTAATGPEGYQCWLAGAVEADLVEGARGFAGSPLKSALDLLRALRDTFRHAVDFGGLAGGDLAGFHRRVVPALNRAVVGPQYERHEELRALLEAGVATTPLGPAPEVRPAADVAGGANGGGWLLRSTRLDTVHTVPADWLCPAHVALPDPTASASPLLAALHRRGLLRRHPAAAAGVPGIDLDPDQHPVRADGTPERRLSVLGPLCEGPTFYTNLVPSPGAFSRPIHDAHRCAAAVLGG